MKSCEDCIKACKKDAPCPKFTAAVAEICHYSSPECQGETKESCGYWDGSSYCPQQVLSKIKVKAAFRSALEVGDLYTLEEAFDALCNYEISMDYMHILVVLRRRYGWDAFVITDDNSLENILSSEDLDADIEDVQSYLVAYADDVMAAHLSEDDTYMREPADQVLGIRYARDCRGVAI